MKSKKRKSGRPKAITPAIEALLLKHIASGCTLHEACRKVGITYETLANERMRSETFFASSARATLLGCEANLSLAETRLKRSTNKRISVDRELGHHFRWKASKLLAAYKDRIGFGFTQEPDSPVDTSGAGRYDTARRLLWSLQSAEKWLSDGGFEQLAKVWKLEQLLIARGFPIPAPKGWKEPWPPPPRPKPALPAPEKDITGMAEGMSSDDD